MSAVSVTVLVICALCVSVAKVSQGQDICQRCECLPLDARPTQAICHGDGGDTKVFSPTTSDSSAFLELVYIYGIAEVKFNENAINAEKPVTLLIQNCSDVTFSDRSVSQLRTLVIRGVTQATVGVLDVKELWTLVLEDITRLTIDSATLIAHYSISISHIDDLVFLPSLEDGTFDLNECHPESRFTLFDTTAMAIPTGGFSSICAYHVLIDSNTFGNLSTGSVIAYANQSIFMVGNRFENLSKQALNLSAPVIHITNNMFDALPAGALRDVQAYEDTFFINNTIQDIDLGGVLLDMSWEIVIEHNQIFCDCAFKRTSILNPTHDMLFLTNSSSEKLKTIFMNNYCNLNCSVNLMTFSHALILGDVCLTNVSQLEQEKLCNISNTIDYFTTEDNDEFATAVATRAEFLIPLCIVVATLLVTSSVCYGCSEMKRFHFKFKPNVENRNSHPLQ